MKKSATIKSSHTIKGFKIGRQAYAKISAIEGIYLSAEMQRDFADFDLQGLSAAQRRKAIRRKYGATHN